MALDIDALVNAVVVDVFGHPTTITYYPVASDPERDPFPVHGIFDREDVSVMTEVAGSELKSAGVATTSPVLNVRVNQFARTPRHGDRVEIDGTIWEVWDAPLDGLGMADLALKKWEEDGGGDADF